MARRRSIYSNRQAQAPGSYETPLADFLDALPGYVNQYQQNKLQEQRYNDTQKIASDRRDLEQTRYDSALKRQEDKDTRNNYYKILEGIPKFDYNARKTTAGVFGFDDEVKTYDELINTQGESMTQLRSKINDIQNLSTESTFYQFDDLVSDIDPKSREMLKATDSRAYGILLSAEQKFDQQRSTNMRAMPTQIKTELANANSQKSYIEREMIKVAQKMPSIDTNDKTAQEILKALRATGVDPTGQLRTLKGQLTAFENTIDSINNDYSIKRPVNELPGKKVPPSITQDGVSIPTYDVDALYDSEQLLANTAPKNASKAEQSLDLQGARYIMATEPEGSPEYESAQEMMNEFNELKETDIGTPKITSALENPFLNIIEKLSIAGKEKEETGRRGIGIRPGAKASRLLPEKDITPDYFESIIDNAESAVSESGAEKRFTVGGLQNPKNSQQYYGGDINVAIAAENSKLAGRDRTIKDAKSALRVMPKTKSYAKQIKRLTKLIKDNPLSQRWIRSKGGVKLVNQSKNVDKIDETSKGVLASFENREEPDNENALRDLLLGIVPGGTTMASPIPIPQD
tara:strand:+ start:802 stop:2526 length:1725 start_codon:yes stop_codon:yes gene_type:complete